MLRFGEDGRVFRFELPRGHDGDLMLAAMERTYELRPIPADAIGRIAAELAPYHPPDWPHWFPTWEFPDAGTLHDVETVVSGILAESGPVELLLTTADPWKLSESRLLPALVGNRS